MSTYIWPIIGFIFAFVLIKKREQIGDTFGDPDWLHPVGGIYAAIVLLAIFIIFWSLAILTGTTHILFKPFLWLFPTLRSNAEAQPDFFN